MTERVSNCDVEDSSANLSMSIPEQGRSASSARVSLPIGSPSQGRRSFGGSGDARSDASTEGVSQPAQATTTLAVSTAMQHLHLPQI